MTPITKSQSDANAGNGTAPQKAKVKLEDFLKLEIRVGKIIVAERVQGSDKLLRLEFDFGNEKRQILAGIAQNYTPESLVGKQMPVIVNLEPRKMRGLESQGMILAIDAANDCALLHPNKEVPNGSRVT
ncbi:Methionine--tRNA ligase [uncultured archaeon]|nr:Methionine--tRNA ligase [uncultured archaeon]